MGACSTEADELAFMEDRADGRHIVQVSTLKIAVVYDENIALSDIVTIAFFQNIIQRILRRRAKREASREFKRSTKKAKKEAKRTLQGWLTPNKKK